MTQRAAAKRKWQPRRPVPSDEQRTETWRPPRHRKTIIVIDRDSGEPVMRVIDLYRTARIDSYVVVMDGVELRQRAGWSRVCDRIRRAFPRLASARHFEQ